MKRSTHAGGNKCSVQERVHKYRKYAGYDTGNSIAVRKWNGTYRVGVLGLDRRITLLKLSLRKGTLQRCNTKLAQSMHTDNGQWRVKCHGNEIFTSTFRKWQHKNICLFPYTKSRVYMYMWNNVIFLFVIWIEQRKRMKAFIGLFHKQMKTYWSCSFSHGVFQIFLFRKTSTYYKQIGFSWQEYLFPS